MRPKNIPGKEPHRNPKRQRGNKLQASGEVPRLRFGLRLVSHFPPVALRRQSFEQSIGNLFGGFLTGDVDGRAFFEIAEPGVLTFGELPRSPLDQVDRFVQRAASVEVSDDLLVTECLTRGTAEWLLG